ncbi:MAG: hypothetical protein QOG85_2233 [Gaiellaceae bacterium]|jgi:hypothetical protein|nr:hypothetical protein [Gaiellaceae bacterium]
MKQIEVVGAQGATIPAGVVIELTAEQAERRSHALEPVDAGGEKIEREEGAPLEDGTYRTLQSVQFKLGEAIGIDGEIEKGLIAPNAWADASAEEEAGKPKRKKGRK